LKILFVIDTLTAGGKERRLTELMKALSLKPGVEFELVSMSDDIHYSEVYDLGVKMHFFIRKSRKDLHVFRQLYDLCKEFKPDIVHFWDSMTAIYATPVSKFLHIKIVNGMVNDSPRQQNIFYQPWLRARITFPFADVIVGNSKAGLKAYKAPENKSVAIYNGFNFERTENLIPAVSIKKDLGIDTEHIIGMVASFSEFKDYPTYFKAAQIILKKRRDVTFLAIGVNTDSDIAKSYIEDSYFDHFRLLGRKSCIESYVNILDMGILSTYTEGISNSILEYMAMGKPVIATNGGGTSEIVIDPETGFLVNQSDTDALADKMELLLNDQGLRVKMGTSGKERIKKVFSIENMADGYLSVYSDLLARQHGNPSDAAEN
jgi:glycosyltransferase involved in cell wall biosynthesis